MEVKIKKLHKDAVIPTYAKPGDAAMDVRCVSLLINPTYIEYDTGLAFEVPEGYVMLIFPRSSNSKKDLLLCNSVGVLDSGYRGPLKLRYKLVPQQNCLGMQFDQNNDPMYNVGDKVGQIMIIPYPTIDFKEVDKLSSTERGEGGFGSTGK